MAGFVAGFSLALESAALDTRPSRMPGFTTLFWSRSRIKRLPSLFR
ncbi:hypothetical protein ACFUTV_23430 [Streptomyces sp. NPDC057298]